MSREELLLKTKNEVISIAKEKGISQYQGKGRKTKEQLVDEILSETESKEAEQKTDVSADDEDWQPNAESVETESEKEAEDNVVSELNDKEREAKKRAYIENVKIGTLVAFNSSTGKVKSAKVTKRSTKNRKLKVETKYGAEFIISFDDVIWVRTNKRWPKGVYQLLKGVVNNEEIKG